MNFSFCCQDISGAGKQKGLKNEDGTPTRSGLVVYGLKAISVKKPKYIMIENVKGLIQKKFIDDFYDITKELQSLGYNCYYPKKDKGQPTCLNAKNYGIPQNRERIFVICIRKDVDNGLFNFPQGFDNGLRLKDLLEDEVDEKYYLSQEIQDRFKMNGSEDVNRNELNVVGSSAPDFRTIGQRDMTYGTNGIMSTLTATDYKQPKQIIDEKYYLKEGTKNFFIKNSLKMESKGNGFRFEPHIKNNAEISKTITTRAGARMDDNYILDIDSEEKALKFDSNNLKFIEGNVRDFRIRKLTPKECWRLMGFRDEHIERAIALGISDSQLYKQAGNSIVVDVLYYIFKELFKEYIIDNK